MFVHFLVSAEILFLDGRSTKHEPIPVSQQIREALSNKANSGSICRVSSRESFTTVSSIDGLV
jgi:hypothetical protein